MKPSNVMVIHKVDLAGLFFNSEDEVYQLFLASVLVRNL